MRQTIFIVDNFYKNPHEVREFALSQTFHQPDYKTGYPGEETDPVSNETVMPIMQTFSKIIGKNVGWDPESPQGMFRLMNKDLMQTRSNMIHTDPCRWTATIYLSLPEDCRGGLSFFQHKETGLERFFPESDPKVQEAITKYNRSYGEMLQWFYEESLDLNKWIETDYVGCKFNRLLLFDGGLFHGIKELFGDSKENTRLSQHFFIQEVERVEADGRPIINQ